VYADSVTAVRLQHASVQVPPQLLAGCAAFYADTIGMRRIEHRAGLAWFEFGDGDHVHLLEGEGGSGSRGHLALQVDDLEPTLERLRAAGHDPQPGSVLWGAPRWFVRDPAGNLVELFQTPPPATEGASEVEV
jgi:catechol 2,3-dioxygenase-like lactoylglutathione lyase family enzyme